MKSLKTIAITAMFTIALTAATNFAEAANWKMIQNENEDGVIEYIDKNSIQKINYNTKKAWIKICEKNESGENMLIAFTKDGKAKLLDYDKNNKKEPPKELNEWMYVSPDTYLEVAYNEVWTKKERTEPKVKNKWERKGENTVERAIDRVINKTIGRIGW